MSRNRTYTLTSRGHARLRKLYGDVFRCRTHLELFGVERGFEPGDRVTVKYPSTHMRGARWYCDDCARVLGII